MLTSTPEAIVMVLEALRRLSTGPYPRHVLEESRAALDAWDRRERLRDDYELRELLGGYAPVPADLDRLCDIAEARLFGRGAGTDTKGTP